MAAEAATIQVSVVYALPERAWIVDLELPAGATASEAMERSGLVAQVPDMDVERVAFSIYGKAIEPGTVLREGDRLELLRPLLADPKLARRRRANDRS